MKEKIHKNHTLLLAQFPKIHCQTECDNDFSTAIELMWYFPR